MYLGNCEGKSCNVASNSPNQSIIITGISGSGKSCRQNQIELESVKRGNTVIVLDVSGNHLEKDIFFKIKEEYLQEVNRIYVETDGWNMNLLTPLINSEGKEETTNNLIFSAVSILSAVQRFGVKQQALLRSLVLQAIEIKKEYDCTDAEALKWIFDRYSDEQDWVIMYDRLWYYLESGIFGTCKKNIEPQKINIIDFSGFSISFAEKAAEMELTNLWRQARGGFFDETFGDIVVVIDEFQHFNLGKNAVLREILREGRKFGINLILTTQSFEIFSPQVKAMLGQMATHLYFKPSENELMKHAKTISPENAKEWRRKLADLRVGECIAVGDKEISGVKISRPLKLS